MSLVTRRDLISSSIAGAGALTITSVIASPVVADEEMEQPIEAESTESCDLLVIGAGGCAGMIAVAHAHELGISVIGIEAAPNFATCNCCTIAGCMGVETEAQHAEERCVTIQELFDHLYTESHFQMNPPLLSNMLYSIGKSCQLILDTGMPVSGNFAGAAADTPIDPNLTMFSFQVQGQERAEYFNKMVEGADIRWSCIAQNLLTDKDGEIVGARVVDADGHTIDINARMTFVATGGFLQNKEMTSQYYGGCELYCPPGNPYNNGWGIKEAMRVGAQIGKNFSTSGSALGGGNSKSPAQFAQYDPTGCPAFTLCFLGGLYVDKHGNRIMKESSVTEGMMWAAEPMIRNDKWYVVVDQAQIDSLTVTPIVDLMGNAKEHMASGDMDLWNVVLSDMQQSVDDAVKEGWAWKADTIEELATATSMPNLSATIERYNGYCADQYDAQMFKDSAYLVPIKEGPFYVLENETIGWLTMGGIKTTETCQAVNSNEDPIPGLYMGGGDADLWSVPYIWGSSTSGFANASGYIVAEVAAGNGPVFAK